MYIVLWKPKASANFITTPLDPRPGYLHESFETLDKAKEKAKQLYSDGKRDIRIVQEIPTKFTVNVEI